jgi:hypothetical protein
MRQPNSLGKSILIASDVLDTQSKKIDSCFLRCSQTVFLMQRAKVSSQSYWTTHNFTQCSIAISRIPLSACRS